MYKRQTSAYTTVDVFEGDDRSALHIFNPATDTFVRVLAIVSVDGASRELEFEVGPERTARIPLTDIATGRFALTLESTGPIVATREITGLSSRSWAPLVPGVAGAEVISAAEPVEAEPG